MGMSPFDEAGSTLLVSRIGENGTFADGVVIPFADPMLARAPAFVELDDAAHALIWTSGAPDNRHLRLVTFNTDGEIEVAPKAIFDDGYSDGLQASAARATSGEIGLIWSATPSNAASNVRSSIDAFFVATDSGGERIGDPIRLATGTNYVQPVIATAADGGFALVWKATSDEAFDAPANVFFAQVSPAGKLLGGPVQLSDIRRGPSGGSYLPNSLAILPADYGYLVAWIESSPGESETENRDGYSVVRLLRIDAGGHALAPAADLRQKEEHIDEVSPTLIELGNAVGVLWSRGDHIYGCSGCIPDHSLELVLLDPVLLQPVSNVVKLPPPARGGILRRSVTVVGSKILTALEISFHVHSEPALAAFSCETK
jgi:hypothetical protein